MNTIIEAVGDRTIGTVEEVSTGGISELLDPDAPKATAINTGVPSGFLRINGYLLIPNESGATVGVITKAEVARPLYPKRPEMQDFGLIDLPFPARVISFMPLGILLAKRESAPAELVLEVRRGVDFFPSVGDHGLLPTGGTASRDRRRRRSWAAGTCPTALGAPVHVGLLFFRFLPKILLKQCRSFLVVVAKASAFLVLRRCWTQISFT